MLSWLRRILSYLFIFQFFSLQKNKLFFNNFFYKKDQIIKKIERVEDWTFNLTKIRLLKIIWAKPQIQFICIMLVLVLCFFFFSYGFQFSISSSISKIIAWYWIQVILSFLTNFITSNWTYWINLWRIMKFKFING